MSYIAPCIIQVEFIRLIHSKRLWSECVVSGKESRLWMIPLLAVMEPLIATVIHMSAKSCVWGESAVAQGNKRSWSGYLVNITDKEDVTLLRRSIIVQGDNDLVEEHVAGKFFFLQRLVLGRSATIPREIENLVDYFVAKGVEF